MTGKRRVRDWQATDPHLRSHPYFLEFAHRLGAPVIVAHGLLSGLWAFAFCHAQDGDLSKFTPAQLALAVGWDGDPDAMMSALTESGFVEDEILHHWNDWGGRLFADRRSDSARHWDSRNRDKQEKVSTDETGMTRNKPQRERERERDKDQDTLSDCGTSDGAKTRLVNTTADFEHWWAAYGRIGSKAEARDLYRWWRNRGKASRDDLLTAAVAYRRHCELDGSKMQHGRTFLAKPTKDKSARWPEWAKGEDHGTMDVGGNGNGKQRSDAVTADRAVCCYVCAAEIVPAELMDAPFTAGRGYCHRKCAKVKV